LEVVVGVCVVKLCLPYLTFHVTHQLAESCFVIHVIVIFSFFVVVGAHMGAQQLLTLISIAIIFHKCMTMLYQVVSMVRAIVASEL